LKAEILSIGTEILVGSILNTNSRFLSAKLAENAIDVYRHTSVGDNPERLKTAFKEALERADLVISSGGLGPTEDDVTVRALASFLGRKLVLHRPTYEAIAKKLKVRGRRMNRLITRQCFVPQGSRVLQNDRGTAPAILTRTGTQGQRKWILLLPGPPRELEPLFTQKALPLLLHCLKIKRQAFVIRSVRIAGLVEVEVAPKVKALLKMKPPLTVGIYAKPGEVELKIMSKASGKAGALRGAARLEALIRKKFGSAVYGVDGETLQSAVGKLLKKRGRTIAAAESCTGGRLSSLLTEVPGSSDYFLGGVIAYHNRVKRDLLSVRQDILEKRGAVSEETAKAMAKSVRVKFKADFGVAITGIAGPSGGTQRKPVGLVYTAVAGPKRTRVFHKIHFGARRDIQESAARNALNLLRLELLK
jgi:nicotinamide-nucleotide amidase